MRYKIKEIGKVITGKTPSKNMEKPYGNAMIFLTPRDMDSIKYSEQSERYLSKESILKLKNNICKAPSISVSCIGSDMGKVKLNRETIITNQQINTITNLNQKIVDIDYLYYLLSTKKEFFHNIAGGSTMPIVNKSQFENIEIELPNIKTQRCISKILSLLDDKLSMNNKIIIDLEKISNNIFKHWFIDFEFPNEQGQPYKSSGGEMVESELGEIPNGWKVVTLKDVCDSNKGSLSKKDEWSFINYLDTSNITKNTIDKIQFINIDKDKVPSRAKRKVQPNDIVYSTVRPNQYHYGIIKEPVENMIASTGFTVLRSKGKYSNDLIYFWLTRKEVTGSLHAIAEQSTSAYPSIKADDILAIKILLPSEKELYQLTKIVELHNRMVWDLQKENNKLSELRDTILPKLLSGEIEIPGHLEVN